MTNQCEHRQLGRTCLLCEMRDENLALRAKLADCQAVIRSRGHDADCWAERCVICGNPPSSFGPLPSHDFEPGPCSESCGHDRTTGEKA